MKKIIRKKVNNKNDSLKSKIRRFIFLLIFYIKNKKTID